MKNQVSEATLVDQIRVLRFLEDFLGSNITTTKKYYLAVRKEDVEKAGTFINKLLTQSK